MLAATLGSGVSVQCRPKHMRLKELLGQALAALHETCGNPATAGQASRGRSTRFAQAHLRTEVFRDHALVTADLGQEAASALRALQQGSYDLTPAAHTSRHPAILNGLGSGPVGSVQTGQAGWRA